MGNRIPTEHPNRLPASSIGASVQGREELALAEDEQKAYYEACWPIGRKG